MTEYKTYKKSLKDKGVPELTARLAAKALVNGESAMTNAHLAIALKIIAG